MITLAQAITAYDKEMIPRGAEEVKCSVENGFMLHDWEKVKESPVFRTGFRPMTGHDRKDELSAHAQAQMQREEQERVAAS